VLGSMSVKPSGFVVMRTPLLSWDRVRMWTSGLESAHAYERSTADLAEALKRDQIRLRTYLQELVQMGKVREALFLASPDLESQLEKWISDPESPLGRKIERTVVKYFLRMAGRATPFGIFAGVSVGFVDAGTRLPVGDTASYQRHTRLDMDYLWNLMQHLEKDVSIRESLRYFPNSSLYAAGGRLRYVECQLQNQRRTHTLVAVDATDYLEGTIELARTGATRAFLAQAVSDADEDVAFHEAQAYIDQLIDSQILVSELTPVVTGAEPLAELIAQLSRYPAADGIVRQLCAVADALHAMDANVTPTSPEAYRSIAGQLADLPAPVELPRLFQVDMTKPVNNLSVGSAVIQEISEGIHLLHQMMRTFESPLLAQFRQMFNERYGDREVPLMDVLDEETGLGLSGADIEPLLDGLVPPTASDNTVEWGPFESAMLARLQKAVATGATTIELDTALAGVAPRQTRPLPPALSVGATIVASSEHAVAQGDFWVVMDGCGGPSGARMLGRFCHADPQLNDLVRRHLQEEERLDPQAIYAEIVHMPEGRIGNILLRPILREYEIPYLGRSGGPADRQIPITDLLVSIRGGRILLRSKRLGRQVVPRLTTAHNYNSPVNLGVYRFLCALQSQGVVPAVSFDWGPLAAAPYLPRVVYRRLILSPARWNVSRHEIDSWVKQDEDAAVFAAVQSWRQSRGLPRWVVVRDSDNELPVDLDNAMCVDALVHLLKGRHHAMLVELLPDPDNLLAVGPEGRYTHELIIPLVQNAPVVTDSAIPTQPTQAPATVSFLPGSEWLYVKLYTGTATADHVLVEAIRPLIQHVMHSGEVDRWFFIRYANPQWHLRVRFHGQADYLLGTVLPELTARVNPLMADGRVWRMQVDTYEPEVERYGGPAALPLAEELFWADSEAVLEIIGTQQNYAKRWHLALSGMDSLLDCMGFQLNEKIAFSQRMRDRYAAEFHLDGNGRRVIGGKFRALRAHADGLLNELDPAFQTRSARLARMMAQLHELEKAQSLVTSREELAGSYIHMHINRLLRSSQRTQEMCLYDLLFRLYTSAAVRQSAPR
jgi:thiopeptide-type bacteriocin biosynthesis protein